MLLGGTDLSLAFDGAEPGYSVIDSAALHAEAIARRAVSGAIDVKPGQVATAVDYAGALVVEDQKRLFVRCWIGLAKEMVGCW